MRFRVLEERENGDKEWSPVAIFFQVGPVLESYRNSRDGFRAHPGWALEALTVEQLKPPAWAEWQLSQVQEREDPRDIVEITELLNGPVADLSTDSQRCALRIGRRTGFCRIDDLKLSPERQTIQEEMR